MSDDNRELVPLTAVEIEEGLRLDSTRTLGPWSNGGPDKFVEGESWTHCLEAPVTGLLAAFDCDYPYNQSHQAGHPGCVQTTANVDFVAHAANHYGRALRQLQAQAGEISLLRLLVEILAEPPMTPEEAEVALEEQKDAPPLPEERIDQIVQYVMSASESEANYSQLLAATKSLLKVLAWNGIDGSRAGPMNDAVRAFQTSLTKPPDHL